MLASWPSYAGLGSFQGLEDAQETAGVLAASCVDSTNVLFWCTIPQHRADCQVTLAREDRMVGVWQEGGVRWG